MRKEALSVITPALAIDRKPGELQTRRRAFMRYVGQGYEIAVDLGEHHSFSPAQLRERFEAAYAELYTRVIPGLDIEVLSWTLSLADHSQAELAQVAPVAMGESEADDNADPESHWQLFDPESATTQTGICIARTKLITEERVAGPALITEAQTTTFVPTGANVRSTAQGDLIINYVERVK